MSDDEKNLDVSRTRSPAPLAAWAPLHFTLRRRRLQLSRPFDGWLIVIAQVGDGIQASVDDSGGGGRADGMDAIAWPTYI